MNGRYLNRHVVILVVVAAGQALLAQAQAPDPTVRFEVASIKPANPATLYASSGPDSPTVWRATNFTLFMLVQQAFGYTDADRIVGGPSWVRETKFDVRAKSADVPTPAAFNVMLRQLLADRFRLRTRVEPRELDVYVARLARPDGRTGPWLVPTPPECAKAREDRVPGPATCNGAERHVVNARAAAGGGRGLTLLTLTMPDLFAVFRQVGGFDRPIVDRTGLTGFFDVSVQYQSADPLSVTNGGTSLVAAAEDQLGLKFERGREMVDVLVIESAQPPTPD